jgi:hypothetical protein
VNCEIIIANQESLSPQPELVEDLMAIIQSSYTLNDYVILAKKTIYK